MNTKYALWRICQQQDRLQDYRVLATIVASEEEASLLARDYAMELRSEVFLLRDGEMPHDAQGSYYPDGSRLRRHHYGYEHYNSDFGVWRVQ